MGSRRLTAVLVGLGHRALFYGSYGHKYPDELEILKKLGVDAAFNIYAEVGTGFAALASLEFGLPAPSAQQD